MNILRFGARLISRSSPVLLLAGGAVLALTLTPVRQGLRAVAVQATKGALVVGEGVKNVTARLQAEAAGIVAEARESEPRACGRSLHSLTTCAKAKGRRMAVATTAGVLAVKEQAEALQGEFKGIVEEAKERRETKPPAAAGGEITDPGLTSTEGLERLPDGLEAPVAEIGPDAPRKRRSGAKKNTE